MANLNWETVSTMINIVLALFLGFQWFWDRSHEHAVKNNVLAIRRAVSRMNDSQAANVLDILDATLATMGSRSPFREWASDVVDFILRRSKKEEAQMLTALPASSNPISSEQDVPVSA